MVAHSTHGESALLDTPSEPISFGEALEWFEGQWILLEVLSADDRFIPVEVKVLARSHSYEAVRDLWARTMDGEHSPEFRVWFDLAAKRLHTGEEVRRALNALNGTPVEPARATGYH